MAGSLWGIAGIFIQAFIGPFAGAAEPVQQALPQDTNYAQHIKEQVGGTRFSTDPTDGRVAAEHTGPLQVFVQGKTPCIEPGALLVYTITVRNTGATATGATLRLAFPAGLTVLQANPEPSTTSPQELNWQLGDMPTGDTERISLTLRVTTNDLTEVSVNADVFANVSDTTFTTHTINRTCQETAQDSQVTVTQTGTPAPQVSKQPAIICDPGEINCIDSIPQLGPNFTRSVNNPSLQPTICSQHDPDACGPNIPNLGPRFAEAVADILPGECRVLEDDIIVTPDYHDALNRRGTNAAFFMEPLFQSGRDFARLVHENVLLGIENKLYAKDTLAAIHTKHWNKQQRPIQDILDGHADTNSVRGLIDRWLQEWIDETADAQQDLKQRYEDLQEERRAKFPPVAAQAITNAETSIARACGPPPTDGGLAGLLPAVQQAYELTLDARATAYDQTQALFRNPNDPIFPEPFRAASWQQELRDALDAFDSGNQAPLQDYLASIPRRDHNGFRQGFAVTYDTHATADQDADEGIRINNWEIALDTPKTVATDCEKEKVFGPYVELTWCESGNYPEFIIQEAPVPAKVSGIQPPPLIGVDPNDESNSAAYNTEIDPQRVYGNACGGQPGDPFWAYDCSCSCDQLVAQPTLGKIRFCQVTGNFQQPPQALIDRLFSFTLTTPTPSAAASPATSLQPDFPFPSRIPRPSPTFSFPSPRISPRPIPSIDPCDNPLAFVIGCNTPLPSPSSAQLRPIVRHDDGRSLPLPADGTTPITTFGECLIETARHTNPNPLDELEIRF